MRIQELYIKNFGKFHNRQFLIKDGVHIFYGENEYGKSTLYAFIKAMLFGMERGRGRASKTDDYSKYEPWENPNFYAGVMRFTCGGKHFYLERNFDRYQKSAYLICEDDGEELSVEDGDLTELLDGMTLSEFENTVAIGQLSVEAGENLVSALQNYAVNYSTTMDQDLNLQNALNRLKAEKKQALRERRSLAEERHEKQDHMRNHQEYLHQEMRHLKEQIEELEERRADRMMVEKEAIMQKRLDRKRNLPKLVLIIFIIGLGVIAILELSKANFWTAGILILLDMILAGSILFRSSADWRLRKAEQRQNLEEFHQQTENVEWKLRHLQEEYYEKKTLCQNIEENIQDLEELTDSEKQLLRKVQALELASDTMQRLAKENSLGFEKQFNHKASRILEAVTDGAYSRLVLDADGELHLYEENLVTGLPRRVSLRQVSRGTVQQVWFAFRMAAAEVLVPEDFPLILDETFAFYDDQRLKSTLKWLSEQSRQVIMFTCQKREREALKAL